MSIDTPADFSLRASKSPLSGYAPRDDSEYRDTPRRLGQDSGLDPRHGSQGTDIESRCGLHPSLMQSRDRTVRQKTSQNRQLSLWHVSRIVNDEKVLELERKSHMSTAKNTPLQKIALVLPGEPLPEQRLHRSQIDAPPKKSYRNNPKAGRLQRETGAIALQRP